MRNLILFIWKNYFFFLFFLLELLCVYLVVANNNFQKASFVSSSNHVSGTVLKVYANVEEYFNLQYTNDLLAKENARLRSEASAAYTDISPEKFVATNPRYKHKYMYIPAKVVNNSTNHRSNYLTLNKGSNQGIKPEMAVIASTGIVGIVKNVSPEFSSVMSLLHKNVTVNSKLKKDGSFGPLSWDGEDYAFATLTDIPTHVRLLKGDTVITSAYSKTFPEAIMVGTVESFARKPASPFYSVKVRLSTDFKKINYVYIVSNIMKDEQEGLENASQTEKDK